MAVPTSEAALSRARGSLRDALGGLSNLRQLLQSVKVGPKAISDVLGSVQSSCAAIPATVRTLVHSDKPNANEDTVVTELTSFIEPRAEKLQSALAKASKKPIYAANRLSLEKVVLEVLPELEAARELAELLDNARHSKVVPCRSGPFGTRSAVEGQILTGTKPWHGFTPTTSLLNYP